MAQLSRKQAEEKVYELTEKLIYTKKDMKDVMSGYKETIKEIENQIKEVIDEYNSNSSVPPTNP